jgi:hypothetical protein
MADVRLIRQGDGPAPPEGCGIPAEELHALVTRAMADGPVLAAVLLYECHGRQPHRQPAYNCESAADGLVLRAFNVVTEVG